jgi:hypothetical protein
MSFTDCDKFFYIVGHKTQYQILCRKCYKNSLCKKFRGNGLKLCNLSWLEEVPHWKQSIIAAMGGELSAPSSSKEQSHEKMCEIVIWILDLV